MTRLTIVSVLAMLMIGCSDDDAQVSTDFEKLELRVAGGFGIPPCDLGADTYDVSRSGEMSWTVCEYASSPAASVAGSRVLSAAELALVRTALGTIARTSTESCGADAAVITLDVTTPSGIERYADDFYSGCPWEVHKGRVFVSGLGDMTQVLQDLRKK